MTPSERSLRGLLGAFNLHGTHDPKETSAPGRRAANERFLRLADPNNELAAEERERRAFYLRKAHLTRCALLSAQARRKKRSISPSVSEDTVVIVEDPNGE